MSKMITASVQTEGFEAVLYPGDGRKDKVLIVISGSDGGMTLTKQESEFYHKNGIPALALALFKTKQTPKELSRVPVEFVEKAIGWLKKQGYKQIGSERQHPKDCAKDREALKTELLAWVNNAWHF